MHTPSPDEQKFRERADNAFEQHETRTRAQLVFRHRVPNTVISDMLVADEIEIVGLDGCALMYGVRIA